MKGRPTIRLTLLIAAALLGGCGGGDSASAPSSATGASGASGASGAAGSQSESTDGSTRSGGGDKSTAAADATGSAGAGALSEQDRSEISDTAKSWLTKGGCELMTARFLQKQTFEKDPDIACKTFESLFQPPSFSAEQITVTAIKGDGGEASAKIGDTLGTGVISTYEFKKVDGAWRIDRASL